jgi:hypothetical protein
MADRLPPGPRRKPLLPEGSAGFLAACGVVVATFGWLGLSPLWKAGPIDDKQVQPIWLLLGLGVLALLTYLWILAVRQRRVHPETAQGIATCLDDGGTVDAAAVRAWLTTRWPDPEVQAEVARELEGSWTAFAGTYRGLHMLALIAYATTDRCRVRFHLAGAATAGASAVCTAPAPEGWDLRLGRFGVTCSARDLELRVVDKYLVTDVLNVVFDLLAHAAREVAPAAARWPLGAGPAHVAIDGGAIFTPADLAANRAGRLTPRQRLRLLDPVGVAVAAVLLVLCVPYVLAGLAAGRYWSAVPAGLLLVVPGMIIIVNGLISATTERVASVAGSVRAGTTAPGRRVGRGAWLAVGELVLRLPPRLLPAIVTGESCRVYYGQVTKRVLSLERGE